MTEKDILFASRYGSGPPFSRLLGEQDHAYMARLVESYKAAEAAEQETGDVSMSTTIEITFDTIEPRRVRAQISGDGTGQFGVFGVFAEAPDAPTAAAQAVKAYLGMNPPQVAVTNVFNAPPPAAPAARPKSWRFSRSVIDSIIRDAIRSGARVRIEYEDSHGHPTTRTIKPNGVDHAGNFTAYDELRQAVRAFKPSRISAVQEL